MSKKLEILTFVRNHAEEEFSVKELCKKFEISQPAMWKNIRELWVGGWIVKKDGMPAKYQFNELFFALITKT